MRERNFMDRKVGMYNSATKLNDRYKSFRFGDTDVFELDGKLSMWRVDGTVYAVSTHETFQDTHTIMANRLYHATNPTTNHTALYVAGDRTYFLGRLLGPDEIIKVYDPNTPTA